MPTILITGANRGIGLEFARQYSADGWDVVATVRENSPQLEEIGVRVETLNMTDLDAVSSFGERLDALDLLVANAGTYGPKSPDSGEEGEDWLATFAINTVAPYLLAQSVLPLVERAGGKLTAISTKMGSIDDNTSGGFIAYRSSKSALNMAWRSLAIDSGVTAAVLHPGWVQTRMGGPSAPLTPEQSVADMRRTIAGLDAARSGAFLNHDGNPIRW